MARVKRGVTSHKRHKRLLQGAEGRTGTNRKLIKRAKEAQLHALAYATRDRKQRAVEFKEVRLTPKIGIGDFETKVHRAIEFLEDGDRVKVTVRFRGRELTHPEIGRGLLAKFGDAVKDHASVDRAPVLEGKSMFMTLASVHKPRVHEHKKTDGEQPHAQEPAPAAAAPAPPRPTPPAPAEAEAAPAGE
jgi:hypothetical protein